MVKEAPERRSDSWKVLNIKQFQDTGYEIQVSSNPGGMGVLGPKTDWGVPLATENWTQKDRGKMEFGAKKIEFCKDW